MKIYDKTDAEQTIWRKKNWMKYWEYNKLQLNCRALRFISCATVKFKCNSDFKKIVWKWKIITNNNYVHNNISITNMSIYTLRSNLEADSGVENEISQSCL